jgi:hypothetical protein
VVNIVRQTLKILCSGSSRRKRQGFQFCSDNDRMTTALFSKKKNVHIDKWLNLFELILFRMISDNEQPNVTTKTQIFIKVCILVCLIVILL